MYEDIKNIYFNTSHAAAYSNFDKLRKHLPVSVSSNSIRTFLREEPSYTLHRPARKKYKRDFVFATNIQDCWHIDLMEMQCYKSKNDGVRYLLVVIDVLSKFLWIRTLRDKTATSVKEALKNIIDSSGKCCETIYSDKGLEFNNKIIREYLKSKDIKLINSENSDIKACVAERVIRTIKEKIWKHFTHVNSHRYIDVLQNLVTSYNNTVHSATKMKPCEVNENNFMTAWHNLYDQKLPIGNHIPKYKKGDHVRISKIKSQFDKGYTGKWSKEIFTIKTVLLRNPVMYEIQDLAGENIKGRFYEIELQKVLLPEYHKINKIIRTRGTGASKQLFVEWEGYPASFNSWIKESDLY